MKTEKIEVKISADLKNKFVEKTDSQGVNRSALIRIWIEKYVNGEIK